MSIKSKFGLMYFLFRHNSVNHIKSYQKNIKNVAYATICGDFRIFLTNYNIRDETLKNLSEARSLGVLWQ